MDVDGDEWLHRVVQTLEQRLGSGLLRYLLNVDPVTPLDNIQFSDSQRLAINVVMQRLGPPSWEMDELGGSLQVSGLSEYVKSEGASVVNIVRTLSGGAVEVPQPHEDPLINALLQLAADVWPIYLAKPSRVSPATFWMSSPVGVYAHPATDRATEEFVKDVDLMRLFPYPAEGEDLAAERGIFAEVARRISLIVCNGQGGSLGLASVLTGLVSAAAFRLMMTGEELNLAEMAPHLVCAVADLRELARGNEVNVPALVGLAGVVVGCDKPLVLPSGRVRRASEVDRDLFLGRSISVQTVYETTFPSRVYAVRENRFDDEDPWREFSRHEGRISAAYRGFSHALDLVRLSLLLASPPAGPWLARETARYVSDITSPGGLAWADGSPADVASFELPGDSHHDVESWYGLITRKHSTSLEIGIRRLLSAAASRNDPIDGLVDAVICWESLFGVQTETSFRVTASIAKLLEPDSLAGREELHKELKALYGVRSRLVHGGGEPPQDQVVKLRKRAVDIGADCFRALYRDRDDLIALRADARGARILME